MLEIVKKRAALRPSDTMMVGSDGYDVSDECSPSSTTCTTTTRSLHPSPFLPGVLDAGPSVQQQKWQRSHLVGSGAIVMGALLAMVVLFVAFVYPALVPSCLDS